MPTFTQQQYEQYLARTTKVRPSNQTSPTELHPQISPERKPRPLVKSPSGQQASSGSGQQRYRIHFTIYSCHPLDWDNAAASIKPAQDAIVRAGWLPSDDWRTLEGTAISAKVKTKAEQRTEVTIELLTPPA